MSDEDILSAKKREGHTVFGMKNVLANPTLIQRTNECWKCVGNALGYLKFCLVFLNRSSNSGIYLKSSFILSAYLRGLCPRCCTAPC